MDKNTIESTIQPKIKIEKETLKVVNDALKMVASNLTYRYEIKDTYTVLHLNEKIVSLLNCVGFTELKTTYISSKKYSQKIIDILLDTLHKLGCVNRETQKELD